MQKNKEKAKVAFNPQVEIFSEKESVDSSSHKKSSVDLGVKKQTVSKKSKNNKSISQVGPSRGKSSVVSSLFRKNPEIPEIPVIENGEQKLVNSKMFSDSTFTSLDISPKLVSIREIINHVGKDNEQIVIINFCFYEVLIFFSILELHIIH